MKIFHFLPNILVFLLKLCFFTSLGLTTRYKVGQQFCEMSLYENTEELFGGFEENDYLCIRYLTY